MAFKIFSFLCLCIRLTAGTDESTTNEDLLHSLKPKLTIYPEGIVNGNSRYLVRRVEETLNLTCKLESPEGIDLPTFNMSWDVPNKTQNSPIRVLKNQSVNALNLIVHQLQSYDEGEYECEAESSAIQLKTLINVVIKKKGPSCADKLFLCSLGSCIPPRYVCDGKRDCPNGKDESFDVCGTDKPCRDKLSCEDGRCIPIAWCCQQFIDNNCTVKNRLQCCHQLNINNNKHYVDHGYVADQQRFSDMTFIQTTLYTVIGCAMAFMFIVTILVIAICRVHMKRSMMSRYPVPPRGAATVLPPSNIHHRAEHLPYYDLDVYLNRSALSDTITAPGLLVTYNINNGVQFVGHPIDPPPYCEVIASPPREGPPPPYASREDLGGESEALLQRSPSDATSSNANEFTAPESEELLARGRSQETRNMQPSSASLLVPKQRENVINVESQTEESS